MFIIRKIKGKDMSIEANLVKGVKKLNRIKPVKYYLDFRMDKKRLKISKFRTDEDIFQPKKAHELFKRNLIYISKDDETNKILSLLISFFKDVGAKVFLIDLCRYCAIDGFITGTTSRFFLYRNEKVCFNCAKKEIMHEMKFRNIAYSDKILEILKRMRNVDKVLELFDPAIDVLKDPSLTLLDSLPADKGEKSVPIASIDMPKVVRDYLAHVGIKELLPVQVLAIGSNLLQGENLMISSATASGKTLIAEMAGLMALKKGSKFVYLSPLVALANQKYEDFKKRFGKEYSVSIRVGMSRIRTKEDLVIVDTDINSDVIVGTYEGFDYILRSGLDIGNIGCIVIDEIHMLSDPERGYRLSGLITRLRTLHPSAQLIGLSATIGNPDELAKDLKMKRVVYDKRPIPLERHIVFKDEIKKRGAIRRIVQNEWQNVSKYGYHGQSMIFTNSRLKCSQIANFLVTKGVKAAAYHSGLSYTERRKIENAYWKQRIQCVVTTAALSAGVDFPSSAVVLESVFMGAEPLSVGEFHQMLGRAGRPGYHDKGKVYILVDPLRKIRKETEDRLAFDLIGGTIEDVDVALDEDQELEELLACMATGRKDMEKFNLNSLWPLPLGNKEKLESQGFLKNGIITEFGKAVSKSFISIKDAVSIARALKKDPIQIAISLFPFDNVYLTSNLQSMLDTNSSRLFSGEVLEKIENADAVARLPVSAQDTVLKIIMEFFTCECKVPYCEHPPQEISKLVLDLRMTGYGPKQITHFFSKEYNLLLYSGDVFSYLDQIVHKLEAVERISLALGKDKIAGISRNRIKSIEKGRFVDGKSSRKSSNK